MTKSKKKKFGVLLSGFDPKLSKPFSIGDWFYFHTKWFRVDNFDSHKVFCSSISLEIDSTRLVDLMLRIPTTSIFNKHQFHIVDLVGHAIVAPSWKRENLENMYATHEVFSL
jgi:triacylglycerol esterase/lipase EstA (alpha/beta hydrolase family)